VTCQAFTASDFDKSDEFSTGGKVFCIHRKSSCTVLLASTFSCANVDHLSVWQSAVPSSSLPAEVVSNGFTRGSQHRNIRDRVYRIPTSSELSASGVYLPSNGL
jgi:hypothetical protein